MVMLYKREFSIVPYRVAKEPFEFFEIILIPIDIHAQIDQRIIRKTLCYQIC